MKRGCGSSCIRCWQNKLKHCTPTKKNKKFISYEIISAGETNSIEDDNEIERLNKFLNAPLNKNLPRSEMLAIRTPIFQKWRNLVWEKDFFSTPLWKEFTDKNNYHKKHYDDWRRRLGKNNIPDKRELGVFAWKVKHDNWKRILK